MTTEKDRVLEESLKLRGFRYGYHDFLAEVDLEGLKRGNERVAANYIKESLLDRKTKELLIMVACVGQTDIVPHLSLHMHAAVKAGATKEEIMEAIELVGAWIGGLARLRGIEAWRATFRPDLPTIERIVELE